MSERYTYLTTHLPGRENVREPMPAPCMEFLASSTERIVVEFSEAQLLAVLADVTKTLNLMRQCRNAPAPRRRDHDHVVAENFCNECADEAGR